MPPLGGQPCVVEIKPADHRADIESRLYRVELEPGARNFCSIRHRSARNDRTQKFGAGWISERFHCTAQGVYQAVACRVVSEIALNVPMDNVIGNIDQNLIGLGTDVGNV